MAIDLRRRDICFESRNVLSELVLASHGGACVLGVVPSSLSCSQCVVSFFPYCLRACSLVFVSWQTGSFRLSERSSAGAFSGGTSKDFQRAGESNEY
jgi:hypothetical protein